MSQLKFPLLTDTWVKATWEEYLHAVDDLDNEKAKEYYNNGYYKLEVTPIGFDHSCDHHMIILAVSLYAIAHQLNLRGLDNCSYRKLGYRQAQPDASYYVDEKADIIPYGTSVVDLDQYPPPDLVIEVSKTTLSDDLGNKRLLYEELGVSEYWVVDVANIQIIAFKVIDKGSQRIDISSVLPGLSISVLNEALQRSRQTNHSLVGQWLMQQFLNRDRLS